MNIFTYIGQYSGPIIGLAVAVVLSAPLAKALIARGKDELPQEIHFSDPAAKKAWDELTRFSPVSVPRILGALECVIFYLSFFWQAYILIVGWLAFKAVSAWPVWQHYVRLPERLEAVPDEMQYLSLRQAWGTRLLTGFLLGTAATIIAAFAGIVISRAIDDLFVFNQ